ncbi:hypothetical protein BGW39_003429 [Mortierella sp. 14UC]|nr:hypothetical protein BGW39_003429 [Mortierella sp. 14UC]
MVLKSTAAFVAVSALAFFSGAPQAEAHSWTDCVDWKFKDPKKPSWNDDGGRCIGYARRYPVSLNMPFGTQDKIYRYFQQDADPRVAIPCSNRGDGYGSNETRANPVTEAYGGKFGRMTVTTVGDTLCVRWPAKNHAIPRYLIDRYVQINLSPVRNGKDITQIELLKNTVAKLDFANCMPGADIDLKACGGCFKVPRRAPGTYLLQWRWMLNQGQWYSSCADIKITK